MKDTPKSECCGAEMIQRDRVVWCTKCGMQAPEQTQEWQEAFDIWSRQGRTEEQKWAVVNFLTGAGANLLREVERTAEERATNKTASKWGIRLKETEIKWKKLYLEAGIKKKDALNRMAEGRKSIEAKARAEAIRECIAAVENLTRYGTLHESGNEWAYKVDDINNVLESLTTPEAKKKE